MFQFGKVITQSLISTFGAVQIAANAAANSLTSLQYIPGGAIGLSITVVIGRCIGAGEHTQARYYAKRLLALTYLFNILLSIPICLFSGELAGLYHLSEDSSALCVQLLILHCIFVSTFWPTAFTLPNTFRAASDVRFPMVTSIISMWIFRVGLSYVLGQAMHLGVIGVWLAIDLLTKEFVYGPIANGAPDIIIWEGVLRLTSVENTGASFGIFQGKTDILTIISIITIIIMLVVMVLSIKNRNGWYRSALILLIAGGIGNIVDRLMLSYVRDWIYFELIDFAVFNLADTGLTVGCVLLIIYVIFFYKPQEKAKK